MRFLTRYKVPFEDLEPHDERALNAAAPRAAAAGGRKGLQEAEAEIAARLDAVIARGAGHRSHARRRGAIDARARSSTRCRRCAARFCRRRSGATRRCGASSTHVRAQAFPDGEPQERSVGFVVVPQQVRSGVRRAPGRGAAARQRARTGSSRSSPMAASLPPAAGGAGRPAGCAGSIIRIPRRAWLGVGGLRCSSAWPRRRRAQLLVGAARAADRRAAARRTRARAAARLRAAAGAVQGPGARRSTS